MPTYSYACTICSHDFDKFASIANRDAPISEPCPNCLKRGGVTKTIGTPGFVSPNPFKTLSGDHKDIMKAMKKRHNNGKNTIPNY